MASKGWIKMHRKAFDDSFLNFGKFDRFHAWFDLIAMAAIEDETVFEGNARIMVPRGSVYIKVRDLANRWKWSDRQVRDFLSSLKCQGMVQAQGQARGTLLTIEKYGFYQDRRQAQGQARVQAQGEAEGKLTASSGQAYYYMKNVKEGEEGEEDVAAAPSATTPHSPNYIPDDEPLPKHVEDWLARTVSTIPRRRTNDERRT